MDEIVISSTDAPPLGQPAPASPAATPGPDLSRLASNLLAPPMTSPEALDAAEQEEAAQIQADDAAAFQGPASPMAYNFGALPPNVPQSREQEMALRTLFHQEGIPTSLGNYFGQQFNQAAKNPPTQSQLELGRQSCNAAIQKLWGADAEKNLAVAQAEVQRMAKTHPELVHMLEVSGLGNSAHLISSLVNIAKAKGRVR